MERCCALVAVRWLDPQAHVDVVNKQTTRKRHDQLDIAVAGRLRILLRSCSFGKRENGPDFTSEIHENAASTD